MRAPDGRHAPGGAGGLGARAVPGGHPVPGEGGALSGRGAPDGQARPDGHVFFPGDDRMEGMMEWPETGSTVGGVVVAHPYPPHGATMALPVVHRIARACRQRGIASLRFNFRGVEGSRGTFSGTDEHRDVLAATAFLRAQLAERGAAGAGTPVPTSPTALQRDRLTQTTPQAATPVSPGWPGRAGLPLALAGYSFGSAMVARAVAEAGPVQALVLVGFPVVWEFLPPDTFSRLEKYGGPVFALCAEQDEVGSPRDVERVLSSLGVDYTLEVIEGAGHFLEGRHREAGERVAAFLAKTLDPLNNAASK